ncbi:MAG TPA: hypothetical protein VGF60_19775 [Xanthobacteraceae bacterium]|jgi:hypothetical protein
MHVKHKDELPKPRDLLLQWLMGMALGVLCAGMLLQTRRIDVTALIQVRQAWLATLIFLTSIGASFGLGATLTGAALMVAKALEGR